ncbi:hypothetical protein PINS_up004879 [Pythium insidiosum]|nr:hypothetical protein PINS_up004879 [Pythium insidiosum]
MLQHVPVVLPPAYASLAGVLASSGDLSTLDKLLRQAESAFRQQQQLEHQHAEHSSSAPDKKSSSRRTFRESKPALQHGALRESEAILALLTDPRSEFPLGDMSPSFQREVTEMQLFVYGEQRRVDDLVAMLERSSKTFPLSVRHFQVAMEYCFCC